MLRDAALVAGKDLRIERRTKVGIGQIVPFALTILILFAFALDPDRGLLARVAAGLFWTAVLLSTVLAVQRSFAIESTQGRDGFRMLALDPAATFFGKCAAVAIQLLVLQVTLAIGVYFLYDVAFTGIPLLFGICVLATLGLAAAGTIYGALSSGVQARETLLPLLFLPIVAPVLLGATRATESVLASAHSEALPWMQLLGLFAAVYVLAGAASFGALLEDS